MILGVSEARGSYYPIVSCRRRLLLLLPQLLHLAGERSETPTVRTLRVTGKWKTRFETQQYILGGSTWERNTIVLRLVRILFSKQKKTWVLQLDAGHAMDKWHSQMVRSNCSHHRINPSCCQSILAAVWWFADRVREWQIYLTLWIMMIIWMQGSDKRYCDPSMKKDLSKQHWGIRQKPWSISRSSGDLQNKSFESYKYTQTKPWLSAGSIHLRSFVGLFF